MSKSKIVNLVLLNSLMVLSGCGSRCEIVEKENEQGEKVQTSTCTGSRGGSHYRPHFWPGGSGFRSGSPTSSGSRSGSPSSSVGRGGFGSTGHGIS